MYLSNRITSMDYSPIRKLSGFIQCAKEKGVNVIGLNIGQPDLPTPSAFKEKIREFDSSVISYSDSRGLNLTVNAFVDYYNNIGLDFDESDLVLTNGGSEALLFSFIACCDTGDEIIVPSPYYSNYNNFADMASVNLVKVQRDFDMGYALPNIEQLEDVLTSKSKAILICNPCNPTGVIYTPGELKIVLDFAVKHNLYVICDEVYRDFVYDENEPMSILNLGYAEERIVLVDSVSKRYSSCGCRIGVLASKNRNLMDNIMKLCQSRLCIPTIEQFMLSAINEVPTSYLDECKAEYENRRNILVESLSAIDGVECSTPGGAFYVMVRLPVLDGEHFAKWLVSKYSYNGDTVAMAPASKFYGVDGIGMNEVRLSYCVEKEALIKAANIIKYGLIEYKKKYK